jgi:epoxyqueuosine reductase
MNEELAAAIRELALRAGYAACGIATAEPFAEFDRAVRDRIARFPEAAALYAPLLRRADPRAANPWARSLVVCARWYGKYRLPPGPTGHIGRNYLCDRRHADSPDHEMPRKMTAGLRALGLRVRRGGLPDRWAAARAGVARFGRNGFAYSPGGSWMNIESWATDAALPPDEPTPRPACPDGCRACMDACPTGALVEPCVLRMDRCVAYLTYGAAEPVAPELWEKMGPWIYGCDACQEVCPLNRGRWSEAQPLPWLEAAAG